MVPSVINENLKKRAIPFKFIYLKTKQNGGLIGRHLTKWQQVKCQVDAMSRRHNYHQAVSYSLQQIVMSHTDYILRSSIKAGLHYSDYYSKLVRFELQKIFSMFKKALA